MKRFAAFALIALLAAAGLGASGKQESKAGAQPVKLVVWWQGESEAPGTQKWLGEAIEVYQQAHPQVTVEAKLQSQDTMITEFKAAATAKDPKVGPDIQYFWDGTYTLEDAWSGNLAPLTGLIPDKELSSMLTMTRIWDGKAWGAGFYLAGISILYNKSYFRKAGLDPENPPKTWNDFMAACAALKKAGITPFSFGLKDQWGNGWFVSEFGFSQLDSMEQMTKLVADGTFVDEEWVDFVRKVDDMRRKGYFNDDAASIDFLQGWDLFPQGKVAMTMVSDSLIAQYAKMLGTDNLGIMTAPAIGTGKLSHRYSPQIQGLGITSWSVRKKEAADFLTFLHGKTMIDSFYNSTGILPADSKFDPALIKYPQQKLIYDSVLSKNPRFVFWMECFFPAALDYEGWYPTFQQLWSGELNPEGVIHKCQEVLEKWRQQNPQQVDIYRKWDIPEGF